jgi:hypothetical protein
VAARFPRRSLLGPLDAITGNGLACRSPMRDAVHAEIPPPRRHRLHLRAARALLSDRRSPA